MMEALLWFLIGALAYRIRGGLLDDIIGHEISNNYIRSVWALAVTVCISPNLYLAPCVFIFALLGVMPGYFGGQFDLSRPENRNLKNYAPLTARGAFIMVPCLALYPVSPHVIYGVIAGCLFVPFYLIGIPLAKRIPIMTHTQWGEYLLGGTIMGALWLGGYVEKWGMI